VVESIIKREFTIKGPDSKLVTKRRLYSKSLLNPISSQNTKNPISGQGDEMENRPKRNFLPPQGRSYSPFLVLPSNDLLGDGLDNTKQFTSILMQSL
jgi:hypothetical protein